MGHDVNVLKDCIQIRSSEGDILCNHVGFLDSYDWKNGAGYMCGNCGASWRKKQEPSKPQLDPTSEDLKIARQAILEYRALYPEDPLFLVPERRGPSLAEMFARALAKARQEWIRTHRV